MPQAMQDYAHQIMILPLEQTAGKHADLKIKVDGREYGISESGNLPKDSALRGYMIHESIEYVKAHPGESHTIKFPQEPQSS